MGIIKGQASFPAKFHRITGVFSDNLEINGKKLLKWVRKRVRCGHSPEALGNQRPVTSPTNSTERWNGNRRGNKEGKDSFLNFRWFRMIEKKTTFHFKVHWL